MTDTDTPAEEQFRVMYRSYDGMDVVYGEYSEESARAVLAQREEAEAALSSQGAPQREWWIEHRQLPAWGRVNASPQGALTVSYMGTTHEFPLDPDAVEPVTDFLELAQVYLPTPPDADHEDAEPQTFQVEVQRMITTTVSVTAVDPGAALGIVDRAEFQLPPIEQWAGLDGYTYVVFDSDTNEELLRRD